MEYNQFKQPIGKSLINFNQPKAPTADVLEGTSCRLEKLASQHISPLFNHFKVQEDTPNWTYLPDEQPKSYDDFSAYINNKRQTKDPYFFAIIDQFDNDVVGILSLLRINEQNATIEVG